MARRAALGLIAFATWFVWQTHPSEPALVDSSQRPIGAFGVSYRQATMSPDGGLIAFAEHGKPVTQIWIKNLAQGDPLQITSGDAHASHPTWSPNNDQIVFARRGQGLWSVPPLGGTPRRLLEFGENPNFPVTVNGSCSRETAMRSGRHARTGPRQNVSAASRRPGIRAP